MKIKPGTPLRVSLAFGSERIVVGRLALDSGEGVFEYARAFLGSGLALNPLFPAPSVGLLRARNPRHFDGLHGVFADSLPDAWGELLVRRRAESNGIIYSNLTALDKLALVGSRGSGALVYEPEIPDAMAVDAIDLDALSSDATDIIEGRATDLLPALERLGGSSGGARPKVLVGLNSEGALIPGDRHLPAGYEAWIVKFRSSRHDIEDIGPLEAAYAVMAREAGLDISETRLICTHNGQPGYFATKRFDRLANNTRVHMLSAAAVLDTRWDIPAIDYADLLKLTRRVTRNQADVERAFDRMVFNVLAHNRDDHAKQHAFLMDDTGVWRLSPPYDLTFSRGPGGEHYLAVNGRGGDDISFDAMAVIGDNQGIAAKYIRETMDRVTSAVRRFPAIARDYGVGDATLRGVNQELQSGLLRLSPRTLPRPTLP